MLGPLPAIRVGCVVELALKNSANSTTCSLPQQCATAPCCGNHSRHVADSSCPYGIRCLGTIDTLDAEVRNLPNGRVACTSFYCNAPVNVVNGDTCFYDRGGCRLECGDSQLQGATVPYVTAWQFNPGESGGWYAVSEPFQDLETGQWVKEIPGVGRADLVWHLDAPPGEDAPVASVLGLNITAGPLAANGTTLGAVTVVEQAGRLVLYPDRYTNASADFYNPNHCVGVDDSGAVRVVDCSVQPPVARIDWRVDPSGRVSLAGHPGLCFALYDALVAIPCAAPCDLGDEKLGALGDEVTGNQLFYANHTDTVYGVSVSETRVAAVVASAARSSGAWVGYLLNAEGQCATVLDVGVTAWTGCRSEWMYPLETELACQAGGVFRFVCEQGYGGPVRAVQLVDTGTSDCVLGTQLEATHGSGAVIARSTDDVTAFVIETGGHGYMNGAVAASGTCEFVISVHSVIVERSVDDFLIEGVAFDLVNLTDIVGHGLTLDTVHAASVPDATAHAYKWVTGILVTLIVVAAVHLIRKSCNSKPIP